MAKKQAKKTAIKKPIDKMYLVVVRTNLDELPVFLTSSKGKAKKRAHAVTESDCGRMATSAFS